MEQEGPSPESYVTLTAHDRYRDAQQVVDELSDRGFPVETVRIVGSDVIWVEDVTGRRGFGQAAGAGAASGAWIGLIVGLVVGLFDLVQPLASAAVLAGWGLVIGLVSGAIAGVIGHALTRGRHDFSSVGRFTATSYRVEVVPTAADRARRLLEGVG